MATKRPDKEGHDSTMELSVSQLVVPPARPVLNRTNPSKNDMSVWGQVVVGTDDFAPPAKPEGSRKNKLIVIGVVAFVVAAAGVYLLVSMLGSDEKPSTSPVAATTPDPTPAAKSVVPADPAKAGSGSAAKPAGSGSAKAGSGSAIAAGSGAGSGSSAGAGSGSGREPTIAATPEVDAISGVAPVIKAKKKVVGKANVKKPIKKPVVKKPVPKKK